MTDININKIVRETMISGCLLAKKTSHEDFVEGIKNKEMIYEILLQNKSKIIQGRGKLFFTIYVLLYLWLPPIFIPIFAYQHHNWFILIGLAVTYIGVFWGARKSKFAFYSTMALLGWWTASCINSGFHLRGFPMFFLACLWWGYMWYQIADVVENQYTFDAIMSNPDLYYNLAENDLLFIMKKPEAI